MVRGQTGTLLALLAAVGCGDPAPPPAADTLADAAPFLANYADMLHTRYGDAVIGAEALERAVGPLVGGEGSEAALAGAREAWIRARPPYLETEVARFYGGPIDGEHGPEDRINGWPLDEAYLDYVVGPPGADGSSTVLATGLINLPELLPEIGEARVRDANLRGGEENVAAGYHAIEFLLWGQDLSPTGPGARPHTDYLVSEGGEGAAARRGAYLGVVTGMLVRDLRSVRDAWDAASPGSYRAAFLRQPPREALAQVLRGMASLAGTELGGERLNVPYLTRQAEDEHSCFSDTTHRDHLHDAQGLANVYLGRLAPEGGRTLEGPGLSDVVRSRNSDLDARARAQLEAVLAAIARIPPPFDQAILGADDAAGRVAVLAAIRELRGFTATLVEIAELLGIRLNVIA